MNLKKKKKLIARVLNVGAGRIILDESMKDELKEAITRQDIRELKKAGAIKIKEKKGRRKAEKRRRRWQGKIKKKIKKRKQEYVGLIRKLREYIKNLKIAGKITKEQYKNLRKKAKARAFKDLAHLKSEEGKKL